jgi:fatty-acyl-CoA synthase
MTPLTSNSSGTTGSPKSNIKHHNILNNGYIAAKTQRITEEDKIVIPSPYTIALVWYGNLSCISKGATMIYPNETFDAEATLKQFLRKKLPFMEYPRCFLPS